MSHSRLSKVKESNLSEMKYSPHDSRFPFGAFYGELQRHAEFGGLGLTETLYPPHARLPLHAHETLYVCLVLKGNYEETVSQRHRLCQPSNLVLHPAGEAHANNFGKKGGACFNVEFSQAWLQRVGAAYSSHKPNIFSDPSIVGLAARLRQEFLFMDDVSSLAIEGLALEIIATVLREKTGGISPQERSPLWLRQAKELIYSRFDGTLTLLEIATAVNRHPIHLAREFRRHHRCTIGEYIRRLRIEKACHSLTRSDEPLVMIALACGFSGQAHFSTSFKRATGFTPARYREAFRMR